MIRSFHISHMGMDMGVYGDWVHWDLLISKIGWSRVISRWLRIGPHIKVMPPCTWWEVSICVPVVR